MSIEMSKHQPHSAMTLNVLETCQDSFAGHIATTTGQSARDKWHQSVLSVPSEYAGGLSRLWR